MGLPAGADFDFFSDFKSKKSLLSATINIFQLHKKCIQYANSKLDIFIFENHIYIIKIYSLCPTLIGAYILWMPERERLPRSC